LEENETLYEKLPIEKLTKSIKKEKWYLKNIYLTRCDKVEIIIRSRTKKDLIK
jgi:hypothetical protein